MPSSRSVAAIQCKSHCSTGKAGRTSKMGSPGSTQRSAITCLSITSLGAMLPLCGYMSLLALAADHILHYLHIHAFNSQKKTWWKSTLCISPNEKKKIWGLVLSNKRTRERHVSNKRKLVVKKILYFQNIQCQICGYMMGTRNGKKACSEHNKY